MINSVYSHYATSNTTSAKEPVLSWGSRAPMLTQPPLTPQLSSAAASGLLTSSSHRAPNTDPNPLCQSTLGISAGLQREGKHTFQTGNAAFNITLYILKHIISIYCRISL